MFKHNTSRILMLMALMVALTAVLTDGQMDWKLLAPITSPQCRDNHAMAYDAVRKRVVLVGGWYFILYPQRGYVILQDTWEWDGKTWKNVTPTTGNPDCAFHEMVYDAARHRIVLFGGYNSNYATINDTWEWDGSNWKKRTPATSPSARLYHTMAYDTARCRVVLFGGGPGLNDTWEWDGSNWKKCITTSSPTWNMNCVISYDPIRQRNVLFGGGPGLNETWEWNGQTWTRYKPATSPPGGMDNFMTYDSARQRTLLFAGPSDTWAWNGRHWTRHSLTTSPRYRCSHIMTYDAERQKFLLFGGCDLGGKSQLNDTWECAPSDLISSTHFVSIVSGGKVKLSLDTGTTHASKHYCVLGCMDGSGPRGIQSGKINLLLYPDDYFVYTVNHPNTLISRSLGQLDAFGQATALIQVPSGLPTSFIGLRFYHAYVVFQKSLDYASTPVPLTFGP